MTECNVRRFAPGSLLEQRADAARSPARAELVAALARQDPAFNPDGETDAYLQGRLDAINARTVSLSREVEVAAGEAQRNLWREASPFAERGENPGNGATNEVREDADQSFTVDEIRAASHAQTRDAWKGNAQPAAASGTTWNRTASGTLMARV